MRRRTEGKRVSPWRQSGIIPGCLRYYVWGEPPRPCRKQTRSRPRHPLLLPSPSPGSGYGSGSPLPVQQGYRWTVWSTATFGPLSRLSSELMSTWNPDCLFSVFCSLPATLGHLEHGEGPHRTRARTWAMAVVMISTGRGHGRGRRRRRGRQGQRRW